MKAYLQLHHLQSEASNLHDPLLNRNSPNTSSFAPRPAPYGWQPASAGAWRGITTAKKHGSACQKVSVKDSRERRFLFSIFHRERDVKKAGSLKSLPPCGILCLLCWPAGLLPGYLALQKSSEALWADAGPLHYPTLARGATRERHVSVLATNK